jgi:tetratricopeptide (TPR) repeat protein
LEHFGGHMVLTFQSYCRTIFILVGLVAGSAASVPADQADKRLEGLFERLKTTDNEEQAAFLNSMIWAIWMESENESVNAFMAEGIEKMSERRFEDAVAAFTKVIEADPEFAEGWNKRATVYYILGDFPASIRDIKRTLSLEPRHFGALSGLGLIFLAHGDEPAALKAFEAALRVNPHLTSARMHVEDLRRRLGDNPI